MSGRSAAKRTLALLPDRMRCIDGMPLASRKPSVAEILARAYPDIDPADFRHSFVVRENIPADDIELPHRPVNTFHLVLDTRDQRYSCRNNVVIGPGNAVFYEDSVPFDEMSVRLRLLEKPRRVRGTVAYLSNTNPANYYHWLAFSLPLIGTYRDRLGIDPDYYYVGRPIRPFHLETLARAGVGAERVLSDAVSADRLVADFPDRRRRDGAVDRAMLTFSRDLHFEPPANPPTRRLFVGRRTARRRRLANEDQCAAYAARYGFETVSMDGRTVADQARLFAEAAFIIAPHGAALTNMLFATAKASVLELLPPRPAAVAPIHAPILTAFREICAFVGCRYDYIFGVPLSARRHVDQSRANFAIPTEQFCTKLAAMLAAAR
jgi:Glycosyltransferase 61